MRSLAFVIAALLALQGPLALAQVRLPALGESASDDLNAGAERRLGEQIMRDVWRDPAYLDDPMLLDYVQSLWRPLVAAARAQGHIGGEIDDVFAWQIFLVRDPSVNAFALPGGYVGVHLGLIAITSTRDELASVIAHELSHVTQRHLARSIGASQRTSIVSLAAMFLGVLAASRTGSADMAQAAVVGGQAAMVQGQLSFSRDVEREADRIGFSVLHGAGFADAGMASMFEKLEAANRLNDSGAYPYLRSHPLTGERLSEARSHALGAAPAKSSASAVHALMAARARVLMDPRVEPLRRQQSAGGGSAPAEQIAGLYARALASLLLRDMDAARQAAGRALELGATLPDDAPAQRALRALAAEVALGSGDAARAAQLLAARTKDDARPELILRARAALAANEGAALRDSIEALQTWTAEHPADALAWAMLGDSAQTAELPLRAARARAEARAAVGDLAGAVDILGASQRTARPAASGPEYIDAQIIDARRRELSAQLRQQQLELKQR